MKDMYFDFSVDYDGDIEDVSPYDDDLTETECEEVVKKLVEKDLIELGERSEGNIDISNGIIRLDYRVCTEVGEDWGDDVWEDVTREYPVSVIE